VGGERGAPARQHSRTTGKTTGNFIDFAPAALDFLQKYVINSSACERIPGGCEPGIYLPEPGNKFVEPGITGSNSNLRRAGVVRRSASNMPAEVEISIIRTRHVDGETATDDRIISRPNRGGED
jgi:hypothetical protein